MATSKPPTGQDGLHGGLRPRYLATHARRPSDGQGSSSIAAVPAPFGSRLHLQKAFWVLELSGECDLAVVDELTSSLADAEDVAEGRVPLVVDVSRLTFCDARSAGLILATSRAVRTRPFGANGIVKRVFDLFDRSGGPAPSHGHPDQPSLRGPDWSTSHADLAERARTIVQALHEHGPAFTEHDPKLPDRTSHSDHLTSAEEQILDLQRRLLGRTVIGQAEGVLMERHHISAPEASLRLRICSQLLYRTLRDVARDLVETGKEPLPDSVLDERIARERRVSGRAGT